uniref:Uncharacterized protein n=1 Tax=Anopheles atroparvus TaxID=41427 RepID=A0AAG5DUP8_ANOAO
MDRISIQGNEYIVRTIDVKNTGCAIVHTSQQFQDSAPLRGNLCTF